jgi:hypothetical protein
MIQSVATYPGVIWVRFDPLKQVWHDKLAPSLVLHV